MSDIPRDDLIRMVPAAAIEIREDDEDGRTLTGVPIVFNQWTEINGWEGNFLERIDPSALTKTLAERGDKVKVLFNHGFDPQIGDKPLGKPSRMDVMDDGLHVEVPLARTSYNDDLLELLRVGAIDGQSFRFSVTREDVEKRPERSEHNPRGLPERTIKELRLYEFGPVTFPAYEATTVGVRAREAYMAWRQSTSDAAPRTSDETPDTPPIVAPAGRTQKQRRYLADKALADLRHRIAS